MGHVLKPLAKSAYMPLGVTAAASAGDARIHEKKILGSGMTASIVSKEEMDDIMELVKSLEESSVILKGVSKRIKNEEQEQNGGILTMVLGT